MAKNPWIAAVLNVLIAGLGYVYIGKRVVFGALLIVSEFVAYIWFFSTPEVSSIFYNSILLVSAVLAIAAFGFDAFQLAKES